MEASLAAAGAERGAAETPDELLARAVAAGLRRWTIPAIGALTPVGLIVVNIAVFIVHTSETPFSTFTRAYRVWRSRVSDTLDPSRA